MDNRPSLCRGSGGEAPSGVQGPLVRGVKLPEAEIFMVLVHP